MSLLDYKRKVSNEEMTLDSVIDEILSMDHLTTETINNLHLIKSNFKGLEKQHKIKQVIKDDEFHIEKNKILDRFFNVVDQIDMSLINNTNFEEREQYQRNIINSYNSLSFCDIQLDKFDYLQLAPLFYYHKKNSSFFAIDSEKGNAFSDQNVNTSLLDFTLECFLKNTTVLGGKSPRLLLLQGPPGIGKTVFCLQLMKELIQQPTFDNDIVYVNPYMRLEENELVQNPLEVIHGELKREYDYIVNKSNAVYVLDDLDFSFSSEANWLLFIENLEKAATKNKCFIIVTLRRHLISINLLSKKLKNRIYYFELKPIRHSKLKEVTSFLLSKNDGSFSSDIEMKINNVLDKLPEELAFFKRIIGIPIVFEFLVKQIKIEYLNGHSSGFQPDKKVHLVSNLITYIYNQGWRKNHFDDFEDQLELKKSLLIEASGITHNSKNNTVALKELSKSKLAKNLIDNESSFKEEFRWNVLIASFILASKEGSQKDAFSFPNEAIQNYLYAVNLFKSISVSISSGIHREKALKVIWTWFVDNDMGHKISEWLKAIVQFEAEKITSAIYENLKLHFPFFLEKQLLSYYRSTEREYQPIDRCLNGFYHFWHFLKALNISLIAKGVPPTGVLHKNAVPNFIRILKLYKAYNYNSGFDLSYEELGFNETSDFKVSFSQMKFYGDNFSKAKIYGASFINVDFEDVNFCGAEASEVTFHRCRLKSCEFREADLKRSELTDSSFSDSDFSGSDLTDINAINSKWERISLEGSKLKGADLTDAYFTSLSFDDDTSFEDANFENVNFSQFQDFVDFKALEKLLFSSRSLYRTRNIPKKIKDSITNSQPHLFENPNLDSAIDLDPILDDKEMEFKNLLNEMKIRVKNFLDGSSEVEKDVLLNHIHYDLESFKDVLIEKIKDLLR
jgi:uncharacterized protein YjbI with pentapeptide repeats